MNSKGTYHFVGVSLCIAGISESFVNLSIHIITDVEISYPYYRRSSAGLSEKLRGCEGSERPPFWLLPWMFREESYIYASLVFLSPNPNPYLNPRPSPLTCREPQLRGHRGDHNFLALTPTSPHLWGHKEMIILLECPCVLRAPRVDAEEVGIISSIWQLSGNPYYLHISMIQRRAVTEASRRDRNRLAVKPSKHTMVQGCDCREHAQTRACSTQ